MKKQYTKPALYAESFIMAEHIATGCLMDTTPEGAIYSKPTHGLGTVSCAMWMGGEQSLNFFRDDMDCDWTAADTNMNCYNSFLTPAVAFSS